MSPSLQKTDRIGQFKKRIEVDGREFCEELFYYTWVRLMCFKYAYYELNETLISDQAYDLTEDEWYVMGQALGLLKEDEISPCVDWNENVRFAQEGKELALKLSRRAK